MIGTTAGSEDACSPEASLQSQVRAVIGHGISQHVVHVVEQLLARAPQWIRQDLLSNDPLTRRRAEKTLAAMIAAALASEKELEEIAIAPLSETGSTGA